MKKLTMVLLLAALAPSLGGCGVLGIGHNDRTASIRRHQRVDPPHAFAGRAQYSGLIERHARQAGVSPQLAAAVVQIESGYNPNSTGGAGEIGLMQIKYETAKSMGYTGDRRGLYDPDTNLRFGMAYLAAAQRAGGGTVCGTVMKYQGGLYSTRPGAGTMEYCSKAQAIMRMS